MKTSKKVVKGIEKATANMQNVATEEELSRILETRWKDIRWGYTRATNIAPGITLLQVTKYVPHHRAETKLYIVQMKTADVIKILNAYWKWYAPNARADEDGKTSIKEEANENQSSSESPSSPDAD